jgi:hypothetical protein
LVVNTGPTTHVSQREESLAGKAGAAEEHAHLGKRERRPVQGDPRGVADDREPTVPVTPMRWRTGQVGASRQEVTPEGAGLSQVLADDSRPGAFIFHVRQSGVLSPSATYKMYEIA